MDILIVGTGDIARRAVPALLQRYRVHALVRRPAESAALAGLGAVPVSGDLDDPASLAQLAGMADALLHLAPPPADGSSDSRTRNLIDALERPAPEAAGARPLRRLVYVSTSGVYGDCGGEEVDESRLPHPATARARRRADAEQVLLAWGARRGVDVAVLRVPGIYAGDRLPLERIRAQTPVLFAEDDVYTNHIHADDLARVLMCALQRAAPGACYNASDDTVMKMGDYFDLVADTFGLPRPPRISRAQAADRLPAELLSFMGESRRLLNRRMKDELGVTLRYPTVREGLAAAARAAQGV